LRGWADGYNPDNRKDGRVAAREVAEFVRLHVGTLARRIEDYGVEPQVRDFACEHGATEEVAPLDGHWLEATRFLRRLPQRCRGGRVKLDRDHAGSARVVAVDEDPHRLSPDDRSPGPQRAMRRTSTVS
jgi:hypothetical protein